jgi:hypothetical protein
MGNESSRIRIICNRPELLLPERLGNFLVVLESNYSPLSLTRCSVTRREDTDSRGRVDPLMLMGHSIGGTAQKDFRQPPR